ncbi:uncharacterized protein DC041_0002474 [Schistosoma bovis]|uniref:Uncharacterized protein n=1 Tax=Schistosoma bovis TaxID=6184 RepID=A0A430PZ78_SCHBO|nr:uncharacterized protein DC041_0002474 [Schistosoma bovis]
MLMTALAFANFKFFVMLDQEFWLTFILSKKINFAFQVTYAIGLLVLAIVIPASLIEAQIFCGGRAIYYRAEDFIFASMVHLFLLTFSYSGFILLFLNIKLS